MNLLIYMFWGIAVLAIGLVVLACIGALLGKSDEEKAVRYLAKKQDQERREGRH
jgi:hypothetical protein